jgi:hypothetical protein
MTVTVLPQNLGIPAATLRSMAFWLRSLREDWVGETPTRIHEGGHDSAWGLGSAPPFAPEFIAYVGRLECKVPDCAECRKARMHVPTRNPESRQRTTRAFRKLRTYAPREFDALQLVCVQGLSVTQTAARLTEQAQSKGKPEVYTAQGITLLVVSGLDKVMTWW